ncbi:hypothetical protein A6R68_05909, partial [Neotoma lepida]
MSAMAAVRSVSVAIDASQDAFQFYSRGIYYDAKCSSKDRDHAVLAISCGFKGTGSDGKIYWLVKN